MMRTGMFKTYLCAIAMKGFLDVNSRLYSHNRHHQWIWMIHRTTTRTEYKWEALPIRAPQRESRNIDLHVCVCYCNKLDYAITVPEENRVFLISPEGRICLQRNWSNTDRVDILNSSDTITEIQSVRDALIQVFF